MKGGRKKGVLDDGGVENAYGGKWGNSMSKLGENLFEIDVKMLIIF